MRKLLFKKQVSIIFFMVLLAALSGCWSREEPNALALVNSIIYDVKDDGQYHVVAEIMNPASATSNKNSSESQKRPYITVVGEGESVREAVSNLSRSLERSIFGGHNKVRFFTERFAKKDMLPILDFFARDFLTDETSLMIMIKDEMPENVHLGVTGLSNMVGDYFEDLSEHQWRQTSKSVLITTLDFMKDYYTEGKQPVMGVAELAENPGQSSQESGGGEQIILYEGLAAFKDNKLVGYMDGNDARAYNMIVNNIETSYISVPSADNQTVLKINDSRADIKTYLENDQVSVHVDIKADLHIVEESGGFDISKAEPLKAVEARFNQQILNEVAAAVLKAQRDFQSDIFGFGQYVHIQHPNEWHGMKEYWDDYFSQAAVRITIESSVSRSGEIKKPLIMED